MDNSISIFCKTLASFCKHLQSSCEALKESVERRPIPLDSASSTFIQCLNRRVSSASNDLNFLESMAFGTVSFEELLGHCNEVYKKNESDLFELEDRLKDFGYVPELDAADEVEASSLLTPIGLESKLRNLELGLDQPSFSCEPVSAAGSIMKRLEDDPLFGESLSLRNLGLSDVCLATLASEADGLTRDIFGDEPKSVGAPKSLINVSKDDYDSLPSYIKSIASWEDLHDAVVKMNSSLSKLGNREGDNFFHPDKLTSLGLGSKVRSYLLLLLRMNKLVVETIEGTIAYRVL